VETIDPDRFVVAVDALQPPSPACLRDATFDRFGCDARERRLQLERSAYRQRHVSALKIARQRRGVFVINDDEAVAELFRALSQDVDHCGLAVRRQRNRAAVNHARFFRGHFPQCVAEEFGVIESDGGDERGNRRHDIRRVQPPPHPDFEHRDFALRLPKGDECDQRQRLEVSRRDADRI